MSCQGESRAATRISVVIESVTSHDRAAVRAWVAMRRGMRRSVAEPARQKHPDATRCNPRQWQL